MTVLDGSFAHVFSLCRMVSSISCLPFYRDVFKIHNQFDFCVCLLFYTYIKTLYDFFSKAFSVYANNFVVSVLCWNFGPVLTDFCIGRKKVYYLSSAGKYSCFSTWLQVNLTGGKICVGLWLWKVSISDYLVSYLPFYCCGKTPQTKEGFAWGLWLQRTKNLLLSWWGHIAESRHGRRNS